MPPSPELEAARQKYSAVIQEANDYALNLARDGGNDELIHYLKNMEDFYNNNPGLYPYVVHRDHTALNIYDRFKDVRRELDSIEEVG